MRKEYLWGAAILGLVFLLFLLFMLPEKYIDWRWFTDMGASDVFWVALFTGPLVKIIAWLLIFGFFFLNCLLALRAFKRPYIAGNVWAERFPVNLFWPGMLIAAILAYMVTSGLSVHWTTIQQFLHPVKTGVVDEIFRLDQGFYLFAFPFYQQLNHLLQGVLFLALFGSLGIYILAGAFWKEYRAWNLWQPAKVHLTLLAVLFLLAKIWDYNLSKYGLLYKVTDRLTGIDYTAAHAQLFAFSALSWLLLAVIALLIYSLFRKGIMLLPAGLAVWIGCSFILGVIYPALLKSFVVVPNEYELEKPYLEKHIAATRKAYGLDEIDSRFYSPQDSAAVLTADNPSLADLRLWDYRPLESTYNQLQSIRTYYDFLDIDIDRYPSKTGRRQVMLAARELNTGKLSGNPGWLNLHLTYTHGYGIAANPVNEFSAQGQPVFIVRDLPPRTDPDFPALQISRPQIYFGEMTDHYAVVNSRMPEFDYPGGEGSETTRYAGERGIPLTAFTKFCLALSLKQANFIFSQELTGESRILLHRNIMTRIRKIAPFLVYDQDPYLVVNEGRLTWIIDAYTTSAYYPYAAFSGGFNYIRNSVKVTVDAYTGDVDYYVIDASDPVIRSWQKIFPRLFKSCESLPSGIIEHFRYPEDLFTIQRDILTQYHMTNPKTFYSREDQWQIPAADQNRTPFEPYYVMVRLPGEKEIEFVMMQPFSPRQKPNMAAWLIARCDAPNYGKLVLYNLPKDQNIYGPEQINSRINQDETISQLVTLWGQRNSRVSWGNLLIIPVDGSILYVKPLYIESEQGRQAELKKIVMIHKNQVLLGDTVAEALSGSSAQPSAPGLNVSEKQPALPDKQRIIDQIEEKIREQENLNKEIRRLLRELEKE